MTSIAASAANRFACEAASVLRCPWSISTADCHTSRRAASIFVAMSAIMNATAWCMAIGTPNWTRSFEYSLANSNAARAIPTASAETPGRVRSSVIIASLKPWFSSPSRLPAGTSTSSNEISAVSEARWPSLSSFLSTVTPSASRGTTNALIPRWPASGSVFAYTVYHDAWLPLVMKHLEPEITHLSPCLTARVFIPPTSEPASGSVRQNEASFGSSVSIVRYFFFTSSEPPRMTGVAARPLAISEVPIPEHPQPISSSIRHPDRRPRPGPPYSSGNSVFIRPTSQAFSTISCGHVASRS